MNIVYLLNNGEVIRKMNWDALWHRVYFRGIRMTWDRIEKKEAYKLVAKFCGQIVSE